MLSYTRKRALPIYWQILSKKGSSNLAEQKAFIKPVLRLLKKSKLVVIGDREFHGVELSHWRVLELRLKKSILSSDKNKILTIEKIVKNTSL